MKLNCLVLLKLNYCFLFLPRLQVCEWLLCVCDFDHWVVSVFLLDLESPKEVLLYIDFFTSHSPLDMILWYDIFHSDIHFYFKIVYIWYFYWDFEMLHWSPYAFYKSLWGCIILCNFVFQILLLRNQIDCWSCYKLMFEYGILINVHLLHFLKKYSICVV